MPTEPGAEWSVDFLELPCSVNGFSSLLVFIERVSDVVVLTPMQGAMEDITATRVAQAYIKHVFPWFGLPASLLSDRGPQFRSKLWHEIWRLLGTTVKHSTPHTPHSHGHVERANRIINEMLRTLRVQFPDIVEK